MTPTLMTLASPNVAPSRYKVLPQFPQKYEVISLLVSSAFLEIFFGLPEMTENPSPGTMMLVEYVEPEILRQSRQWQSALAWTSPVYLILVSPQKQPPSGILIRLDGDRGFEVLKGF